MQMRIQLFLTLPAEKIICMQIKIIIQCLQIPVVDLKLNFLYLSQELVTQKWQSYGTTGYGYRNCVHSQFYIYV